MICLLVLALSGKRFVIVSRPSFRQGEGIPSKNTARGRQGKAVRRGGSPTALLFEQLWISRQLVFGC
jgi:hypothetical protein